MSNYIINPFFQFGQPVVLTRNAWVELARFTIAGGETTFNLLPDPFPNKRWLMLLTYFNVQGFTSVDAEVRFNADAGLNYANRDAVDGGADFTGNTPYDAVDDRFGYGGAPTIPGFTVYYIDNNPVGEKLVTKHFVSQSTVGNGFDPRRQEQVSKWVNVLDPITRITIFRKASGSYLNGEAILLGFDPADGLESSANFWEPLGEIAGPSTPGTGNISFMDLPIPARKFLWIQGYAEQADASVINQLFAFNASDPFTAIEYAERYMDNGSGETPRVSRATIQTLINSSSGNALANLFVYNRDNQEKLVIHHMVNNQTDGSGAVPNRREGVAKYTITAGQITKVSMLEGDVGSFGPNSFLKVWGHD